jgi:hypothetical protein
VRHDIDQGSKNAKLGGGSTLGGKEESVTEAH